MTYHRQQREPLWHKVSYQHSRLPNTIKQWLLDQNSLTQKLVVHSNGHLRVEILQQGIQRLRPSEYRALHLSSHRHALVREVVLYGNNHPWVYARTLIPLSTLKGPLRYLHDLGNRPLGSVLFADPSMRRCGLELAVVKKQHLPQQMQHIKPLWGRRSLFFLKGKPLLVSEIFLDTLIDVNQSEAGDEYA